MSNPETNVDAQSHNGGTALIDACSSIPNSYKDIFYDIVQLLLSHPDINVNTQDNLGYTALIQLFFLYIPINSKATAVTPGY